MRILFLNQYFPPDPAPTGILLGELADHLRAAGRDVAFVSASRDYRAAQGQGGRMAREVRALAQILWRGLRAAKPDLVLSATSPPCLLLIATMVAWWHRAKSVHWLMDMYPELAIALGEIRPGFLSGLLRKAMGWAYRRASAVVVLDADMAAHVRTYGVTPEVIGPWVFSSVIARVERAHSEPEEPWTWLYSGNLGRAHEWETLLMAQALLEKRRADIHLVFQGGGPARPAAEARARELGLRQCHWKGYVQEEDLPESLRRAQVLAVTQVPPAQGLLWPSKLRLILSLPRPILWVGPVNGAIARELATLPWAACFGPGEAGQVAEWLVRLRENPPGPITAGIDPVAQRDAALAAWLALIARLA